MGLTPGTLYRYRVGDASMSSWFGQGSFRATPSKGSSETFTFAAAGDWGNSAQTQATASGIAKRSPNLVLPLGDLYYSPADADVRGVYEKWQAFGQSSFVQTAMGNHEWEAPGNHTPPATHCAFSNLPGNERTYAFTWASAFFLTMDWGLTANSQSDGVDADPKDCDGIRGTSAIRAWADAQLSAADADPAIRWKVVFQHFQCYDATTSPDVLLCPNSGHPDQVEDILVNRNVDLVLTAHDHTYGRIHPVRFSDVVQTGSAYDTPGAPLYLVIGTGGESGQGTCRTDPYVAFCRAATRTRGFGWFEVSPTSIRYEFVENNAGVVDAFTVVKRPSDDFAVSLDPGSMRIQRGTTSSATATVRGVSTNPVRLTISGCPTDTTCTVSPSSGSPDFTSALSITTTAASPFGNYPMTLVASNASVTRTAPLNLVIAERVTRTYTNGDGGAYSRTEDAYIYNGTPDANFGAGAKLFVDGDGCISAKTLCRTLIKFPDLLGPNEGQVPAAAWIAKATLELRVTNTGVTQDFYQVTQSWSESSVTWNSLATPGSPKTDSIAFTINPSTLGWVSLDITRVVHHWVDGDPNEGLFLTSAHWNGVDYDSSESANPPKLTVTYDLPADPGPPPPPPPFDFSVAVNPASGSVAPGGSASTTVTATLVSGSTHEVQYSVSNLPTDTTGTFSPTACSPTCSVSLSLTTSPNTPDGTHSVTVTATDGSVSRNTTYALTVGATFVLSFRKGDGGPYSETDDAFIYNGAPNNNYGRDAALYVDASGCIAAGTICRSVLKFPDFIGPNAGQVKPGSTILSATLEVTITNAGGTQTLYQVSEGWTESGVTWNGFAIPGSPATKGNGISFAAPLGVITLNITAIVQNWVNGDPNDGLLITSASTNGADYRSSESIGPPKLTVTFRSGSPPRGEPTESGSDPVPPDGSPATSPTAWNLAFETRTREGI